MAQGKRTAKQITPTHRNWRAIVASTEEPNKGLFPKQESIVVYDKKTKRVAFKASAENRNTAVKIFYPAPTDDGKLLCLEDACLEVFQSIQDVRPHLLKKSTPCGSQFQCQLCGQPKTDLKGHLKRHFEATFSCTEEGCDERFKEKKSLDDHVKLWHRMERDDTVLECVQCQAKLKGKDALRRHMMIHENTEAECDLCHRKLEKHLLFCYSSMETADGV